MQAFFINKKNGLDSSSQFGKYGIVVYEECSKFYTDNEKFLMNFVWIHVGLKNFYSDDGVPWS